MPLTVTYSINGQNIHQGPGYAYLNALCPLPGLRSLVDASNPPNLVDPPAPGTWQATTAYAVGQIIADSNNNIQQCTTAGTSGSSQPTWATGIGATTADGSTLIWTCRGPSWAWVASKATQVDQQVRDSNNNIQRCVVAGTSASGAPTWSTVYGGTTVDGTAQWMCLGSTLPVGGLEGAIDVALEGKFEDVTVDQLTAPVDAVMTAETATIDITLKELRLDLFSRSIAHASYASGIVDSNLPASAQNLEEITVGGLVTLPKLCIVVASPRRGYASPTKNAVVIFYKALAAKPGPLGFTRTKPSTWKAAYRGLAVAWRPLGDQVAKFYRQT